MTIDEYLEKLEKERFDFDNILKVYDNEKTYRSDWDSKAEIGIKILNNDYPTETHIEGDLQNNNTLLNLNFVKDNLNFQINELLSPDVDVILESKKNNYPDAYHILDLALTYGLDETRIMRKMDQVLICNKYMGFGSGRLYWDVNDRDSDDITGKPKFLVIDSRKIHYTSPHNLKDFSDVDKVFHAEQFNIEEAKKKFPEYADQMTEALSSEDFKNNYYIKQGVINIVTCQYLAYFRIKERAIVDESTGNVRYFLEKEFDEFLDEQFNNPQGAKRQKLTELSQEYDENVVMDEAVLTTNPEDIVEKRWFQVIFIPELDLILEDVKLVGDNCEYILMPNQWNPDSHYPTPIAYNFKEIIRINSILLTTTLINTLKLQKPIPIIQSGALKNEKFFVQNYWKTGVVALIDEKWERKHPGARAVEWLNMPVAGQMQMMLSRMIENAVDKSTNVPKVSRGIGEPGDSGKAIQLKQISAQTAGKNDYYLVEDFLTKAGTILKEKIVKMKNYEYRMYLQSKEVEYLDVNTEQSNMIESIADQCIVKVMIEPDKDYKRRLKEIKMEGLYRNGDITYEDFMQSQNLQNVGRLIENRNQQSTEVQLTNFINSNPEIRDELLNLMQGGGMEQGELGQPEQGKTVQPTPNAV